MMDPVNKIVEIVTMFVRERIAKQKTTAGFVVETENNRVENVAM